MDGCLPLAGAIMLPDGAQFHPRRLSGHPADNLKYS
jgi:hypothetical protein